MDFHDLGLKEFHVILAARGDDVVVARGDQSGARQQRPDQPEL
ncbi:hypothetical protein AS9A_0841 [Hoyosella subflava DQS3-9A1]|uniref:Uncharacterized protein n=1 Tax=Hoyosella subflava (strain DSM 45089 / JCM 17490 / NBRC 109087 / DQS3-9A1) TaxID=443218 RepID=F6EM88_HOYSD|nr:hypothetical protein AS9A_0841 [Hoyosella subflava DQS3-9A1]